MLRPGATYMVTRRTTQRQFLLRPSRAVNQAFRYCAALAAQKSRIALHAISVLSNHYHIICTDPHACLPIFVEELNKLLSRCLNAYYGRTENFWAGGTQASYVRLDGPDDVLEKTIYTLVNPVKDGLVRSGSDWPGVLLYRPGHYVAKRPDFFFRNEDARKCLPERVELVLSAPPLGTEPAEAIARIEKAVREKEAEIRADFKKRGRGFLGPKAIKAQRVTNSPRRRPPHGGLNPRVACRDKWRRIEMLQRLEEFVAEYREARKRWEAGVRSVVFPFGTYLMRVRHGAACADC